MTSAQHTVAPTDVRAARDAKLNELVESGRSVEAIDVSVPDSSIESYLEGYQSPLCLVVEEVRVQCYVEAIGRVSWDRKAAYGAVEERFLPRGVERIYFRLHFYTRGRDSYNLDKRKLNVTFATSLDKLEPIIRA